jgi:hypothetical protein
MGAASDLMHPPSLRSALDEAVHENAVSGDTTLLGYAAAEVAAAASSHVPYWQSDTQMRPLAIAGREGTGMSFYLPEQLDRWIRAHRPVIPADVLASALELTLQQLEHCESWQDPDQRRLYLTATLRHLERALEEASAPQAEEEQEPF